MIRAAPDPSGYRVREAIVAHYNGHTHYKRRMFIAERRVSFLRVFSLWWPAFNGCWRRSAQEAWQDASNDFDLHQPLSPPHVLTRGLIADVNKDRDT